VSNISNKFRWRFQPLFLSFIWVQMSDSELFWEMAGSAWIRKSHSVLCTPTKEDLETVFRIRITLVRILIQVQLLALIRVLPFSLIRILPLTYFQIWTLQWSKRTPKTSTFLLWCGSGSSFMQIQSDPDPQNCMEKGRYKNEYRFVPHLHRIV
jgi:hypothetical protein